MVRDSKNMIGPVIALIGLLFAALLLPDRAAAISSVSTYGSALKTICDGNCDKQPKLEARRKAVGFDSPFELGLKLFEGGLDLTIESDGNIFIYGSLTLVGPVKAKDIVILGGALTLDGGLAFPFPPIAPGQSGSSLICACVSIGGGSGLDLRASGQPGQSRRLGPGADLTAVAIARSAGELVIASVVGLDAPLAQQPGISISRAGDIYLDLSMAEIGRLTATAGKSMYFVASDSLPVPEPGTGLLFGLGLISLAICRTRSSTSAACLAAS